MPQGILYTALVVWLMGCGGEKETEPGSVDGAPETEAPSEADDKGKTPNPETRPGKASSRKKGKGKSGAQKPRKGQKATPPNGGSEPSTTAPIGVAGPLEGTLAIQLQEEEGKPTTTLASLRLTWEGGETEVSLGTVPAECKSVPPTPIGPEGKQIVPLWMVDCDGQKADAIIVLHQKEHTLFVRRALVTGEGMNSPYKVVKRVRLAEDATVSRRP